MARSKRCHASGSNSTSAALRPFVAGAFVMSKSPRASVAAHRKRYERTCQTVGHFMAQWAQLEDEINRAIHRLFKLPFEEGAIVTRNLQVRDKLTILRTAIEYYSRDRMSEEWRDEAGGIVVRLAKDVVPDRNVVAHTYFLPGDAGAVEFFRVHASKAVRQSTEVWTPAEVQAKCEQMTEYSIALMQIMRELIPRKGLTPAARESSGLLDPQVPLYPRSPEPPASRSSAARSANRRKSDQTQRKPPKLPRSRARQR